MPGKFWDSLQPMTIPKQSFGAGRKYKLKLVSRAKSLSRLGSAWRSAGAKRSRSTTFSKDGAGGLAIAIPISEGHQVTDERDECC
jgi:hypothetical protein